MLPHKLILAVSLLACTYLTTARAVQLPWTSTYNCAEWSQTQGQPSCDGIEKSGDGKTNSGSVEQITQAANFPGGAGGRGQRHWIGSGNAGVNDYSGGTTIHFNATEVWVRWYMRFEQGFYWAGYDGFKVLYFLEGPWDENNYYMIAMNTAGGIDYYTQYGSQQHYRNATDFGWTNVHGGSSVSDGSWHCYEVYIKSESGPGQSNGVFRAWVDGVLRINAANVNHGLGSRGKVLTGFYIGSNAKTFPLSVPDKYVDYDDFYVTSQQPSNRDALGNPMIGPISPISGPIAPPAGLSVVN